LTKDSILVSARTISRLQAEANRKVASVENGLSKETERILRRWQRLENKLLKKFPQSRIQSLDSFQNSISRKFSIADHAVSSVQARATQLAMAHPSLDELRNTLPFLSTIQKNIQKANSYLNLYSDLKVKMAEAQSEIERAQMVKQFLEDRKRMLKEQLMTKVSQKNWRLLDASADQYAASIRDFTAMLDEPETICRRVLPVLKRIPAFNDFPARHSALGSLLPSASGGNDPAALIGMQTNLISNQLIQSSAASAGNMGPQIINQRINEAEQLLGGLVRKN
jgi:hypothetical protein